LIGQVAYPYARLNFFQRSLERLRAQHGASFREITLVKLTAHFDKFLVEEVNLNQSRIDKLNERVATIQKLLRARMPKADLPILVYDQRPETGFTARLEIR
jgi:hypothetical protein